MTAAGVRQPPTWLSALRPAGKPELRVIAAGRDLEVWHVRLSLTKWNGPWSRDLTYGKGDATVTDESGQSASAEVEVARRLTRAGWQARALLITEPPPAHWRPFVAMARDAAPLPQPVTEMLAELGRAGAPDVLAWHQASDGLRVAGVECKRVGRDRVKRAQAEWYRRAIAEARIDRDDLVVVEWTAE